MALETLPIPPAAFAEAIKEFTLPVLYAKVSELRNSISHLQRSNRELQEFIIESCETEDDKKELEGYIAENKVVNESMNERIRLCKAEVEGRGQTWIELELETGVDAGEGEGTAGVGAQDASQEQLAESDTGTTTTAAVNGTGSSADAPAAERPRDRQNEGGDDGVYL